MEIAIPQKKYKLKNAQAYLTKEMRKSDKLVNQIIG